MIADPDVHNDDVSVTTPTTRFARFPITKARNPLTLDSRILMVTRATLRFSPQMLVNLEKQQGHVELNAPLIVAKRTHNIIDELKEEGTGIHCRNTPDSSSMMTTLKGPRA